ncbi:MAG: Cna domain protein [Bryobacterales bacterium]|nr:Cna domain protein [Bryobacterales bacterium]
MASFLLGYATSTVHDYTFNWPGERGSELGLYVADDWRITRKLTFNLGFRWDYYSPFSEVANRWANFNARTAKIDIAGRNGVDKYVGVKPYYRNFGPRLGFAYQLFAHTVVRGGYGIFYNPAGNEGSSLRLFRQLPYGSTVVVSPGDINVGLRVSDGFLPLQNPNFADADSPYGAMLAVDPNFRPSSAQQFNLTVEHEIAPWSLVIRTALVGNLGRHLYNTHNANQPVPSPAATNTPRPYFNIAPNLSDISYFVSDGLSSYYGGQLTVDKRLSKGLSALLGYSWAHAIDNVVLEFNGGAAGPKPQDPESSG